MREAHTSTLLPNGKVLVAGGYNNTDLNSAELYDLGLDSTNTSRPQIVSVTSTLNPGGSLVVTGAPFRGVGEGAGGNTQGSGTDYPLVQLRSLDGGQTMFLPTTNWGTRSFRIAAGDRFSARLRTGNGVCERHPEHEQRGE